ncbi:MAG: polymer-forming cytoskeletal protein [Schwartzia sp.]|nr:polymer-forming cytoskeletal protein [Schwartzia sp. (in: firmicutes)]
MFESMKKRVDSEADIETIIGHNTALTGQLQSGGNLRIDGRIDGGVSAVGDVIIGESGVVIGDIRARSLVVAGAVTGNVEVSGNLSIYATGQLVGDVRVKSLNIADGGIFQGRSEMAMREDGAAAPQPAA